MQLVVLNDGCPVCLAGPLGLMLANGVLYVRCVECTSYWIKKPGVVLVDPVEVDDVTKSTMRPATLDEVRRLDESADVGGRWSHSDGFSPI
jgi:hypothetical protein